MGNFRINPSLVSWGNVAPKRRGAPLIHETADGIAVDSRRDRLAKLVTPKPFLFSVDLRKLASQIVKVQEKEVVFKARPQVIQPILTLALSLLEHAIVFRTDVVNEIEIPSLEPDYLCILGGNDKK